jgi:hypothetical protein
MSAQFDCPICMDAIEIGRNSVTTICGHKFHASCLLKCVSHLGLSCPYCRSNMAEEEKKKKDKKRGEFPYPGSPIHRHGTITAKKIVSNGINYIVARGRLEVYDYDGWDRDGKLIQVGRWNLDTQQVDLTV